MNLKPMDYCFYCGRKIPESTFPHVCPGCLVQIRRGERPHSVLIQHEIDGETGLKSGCESASQHQYTSW